MSRLKVVPPKPAHGGNWKSVTEVINKHFSNADIEAARVLCSALASHALKEYAPAWCMVIAPPGSMKTVLLECFRGLPGVHFVDEVTTNTFLSGKLDDPGKKRKQPASWLHRIGKDGILIAADFSTFTSNPKTLGVILSQMRRIYDGNFSREFGSSENMDEREWTGRLTVFAGATPDVDKHYSLFQSLGERFVRVRWARAGGVETGLRAMKQTSSVAKELAEAIHKLLSPILSNPQTAPTIPPEIEDRIAHLSELIALARTYVERDRYKREATGVFITEGNTRLPQELCQIARGSALLDGRSEVNEDDYRIAYRAAFDSLLPTRRAVFEAILESRSPYSLGLPRATIERAIEDLQLAGVLTTTTRLTDVADDLFSVAGEKAKSLASNKMGVPAITPVQGVSKGVQQSPSIPPPFAGTFQTNPFGPPGAPELAAPKYRRR